MKGLIFSFSLCALFIFVKCDPDSAVCRMTGGDPEKLSIFAECVDTHFPKIIIDILVECYDSILGDVRSLLDLVKLSCAAPLDRDKNRAIEKCLTQERHQDLEGLIEIGEIEKAQKNSMRCYSEKTDATSLEDVLGVDRDSHER